ncbi:MAG: hypothetical protein ACJ8LM_16740 [Candidatus Udaeobacter sp.]
MARGKANGVKMDILSLARKFALLDLEKKRLQDALSRVQRELESVEGDLLEAFADEGMKKIELADIGRVVHVHKQMWARAADGNKEALHAALRRYGLDDLIIETVNTSTLSSYVREQQREGVELPDDLAATIVIADKHSIRTRAAVE